MRTPRLHVERLAPGSSPVELDAARAHYLRTVLRLRVGDRLRLFNAEAGEFEARLIALARDRALAELGPQSRPPVAPSGPELWFAPIRRTRMEWLVEKAVELGVRQLVPVITARTVVQLRRPERLRAIAVEAAEQCERLHVPPILPPQPLNRRLAERDPAIPLLVAVERTDAPPLLQQLTRLASNAPAVLVGPEGGFSPEERALLRATSGVRPVSLGSTILRSETAALYALSLIRAVLERES